MKRKIKFPNPKNVKTRGRWVKFAGRWEIGLDEVFKDENLIEETEKAMDGSFVRAKNMYVIVESKSGKKTIAKLAEFETTYKRYGICHVYTYTVSEEI